MLSFYVKQVIIQPHGHIWTVLIEVRQMKLHIKYQRSGPSGFRQEDFKVFTHMSVCKKVSPGAEPLLT